MVKKLGYVIRDKKGKGRIINQRIFKTKRKAESHRKGVIKANTMQQRKMTGFINLRVKGEKLNEREKKEMKRTKNYIRT